MCEHHKHLLPLDPPMYHRGHPVKSGAVGILRPLAGGAPAISRRQTSTSKLSEVPRGSLHSDKKGAVQRQRPPSPLHSIPHLCLTDFGHRENMRSSSCADTAPKLRPMPPIKWLYGSKHFSWSTWEKIAPNILSVHGAHVRGEAGRSKPGGEV